MFRITADLSRHGLNTRDQETLQRVFDSALPSDISGAVFLFGSRSTATHSRFSDIDLLLEFNRALTSVEMGLLRESFEESSLPYKVDLVVSQELFEPYRKRIESEKKQIGHADHTPTGKGVPS